VVSEMEKIGQLRQADARGCKSMDGVLNKAGGQAWRPVECDRPFRAENWW